MELPRAITKITWDNALLVAPSTAEEQGLKTNDVVKVTLGDHSIDLAVWVQPGQAPGTVTTQLGYGRSDVGRVADGVGASAYLLRESAHPVARARCRAGSHRSRAPAGVDPDALQPGSAGRAAGPASPRAPRHARALQRGPALRRAHGHPVPEGRSMFPDWEYNSYKWGMAIDLTSCTGCNACVISCQAENNIPIVGREQVLNGREMHWLRIDRYYSGSLDNPAVHHQPVACMHCERAPCELVCPVGATVHDEEGLNTMVYNRCIGTRYCSNNCPYKVRRFNFLKYNGHTDPVLKLARNPNVSVRMRGVMEKCTYCVQRINYARIEAKKEDRRIATAKCALPARKRARPTRSRSVTSTTPNRRSHSGRQQPTNGTTCCTISRRPRERPTWPRSTTRTLRSPVKRTRTTALTEHGS